MLRLALDQNFPLPLLNSMQRWLPSGMELTHLTQIDARLSDVSDRQLFIALYQMGWDGLVTNNWRMLNIENEVAAIVKTKATVIALKGMGDDPIRPAGALLLELPGLATRVKPGRSNVFLLNYDHRMAEDGWTWLTKVAERRSTTACSSGRSITHLATRWTRPCWRTSRARQAGSSSTSRSGAAGRAGRPCLRRWPSGSAGTAGRCGGRRSAPRRAWGCRW